MILLQKNKRINEDYSSSYNAVIKTLLYVLEQTSNYRFEHQSWAASKLDLS